MVYPYQNITNVNLSKGFGIEILYYVNEVSDYWISNMIIIAIYIITIMGVYNYKRDFFEGAAIAGWVTFIVGVLFFAAGFVTDITLVMVIAVAIAGVATLWFSKKGK